MSTNKNIANYEGSVWASGSMIPSPCVNVCQMDPSSGLCVGCHRTLDEIAGWSSLDNDSKRAIWARIDGRTATGAVV